MSRSSFQPDVASTEPSAFRLPPSALEDRLDVFHGVADPAVARVYARLRVAEGECGPLEELTLKGRLVGPECAFAHTLPLRMPFLEVERAGSGDPRTTVGPRATKQAAAGLLAEAVVPDPCFWTPELPFFYRAEIELRRGADVLWRCERMLGIRRLGVRGQSLWFDGKRFVLRGAGRGRGEMGSGEWGMGNEEEFARESWTAVVTAEPGDEICEMASRRGVLVVADLTELAKTCRAAEITSHLRRLAQWPAVGIAVLGGDAVVEHDVHSRVPNLLLAQLVATDEPWNLASWAQIAFAEVSQPREFAHKTADCTAPIVAVRRLTRETTIEEARAGCDALQHDLAFAGDFAGYVV
jgi:hypothetical protein